MTQQHYGKKDVSETQVSTGRSFFPWELGIFDAHCHPTDTMASVSEIPEMKATTLTVMSTRGEDQDLVLGAAMSFPSLSLPLEGNGKKTRGGKEKNIQRVVPCFGWHPWFSHQIRIDEDGDGTSGNGNDNISGDKENNAQSKKLSHYKEVLTPTPSSSSSSSSSSDYQQQQKFLYSLPHPRPLSQFITETKNRLLSIPHALVGEVGLDRSFRLPNPWSQSEINNRDSQITPGSREGRALSPYRVQMTHQKAVLKAQLRLAGELRRGVSVHSVQAHGAVLEVLRELWSGHERRVLSRKERKRKREEEVQQQQQQQAGEEEEKEGNEENEEEDDKKKVRSSSKEEPLPALPFPPRICMHSYSGPVDQLRLFLDPSVPADVYFSFSSAINLTGPTPGKVLEVIKALPNDRVLIESDLHTAGSQMDELLEDVTRTVCRVRGWGLEDGIRQLGENWRRFVFG